MQFFLQDPDIRHYIKIVCITILLFFGCSAIFYTLFQENYDIHLKMDTVEFEEKINIVDLVDSIGKKKIQNEQKISSNTIQLDDYEVTFDELDTTKLGEQTINAFFSNQEEKKVKLTIKVVDTKKPSITFSVEKNSEISMDMLKKGDFSSLFTVSDNCTSPSKIVIKSFIDPEKIDYEDIFTLTIEAIDQSGNVRDKQIKLKVEKDPEKIKEEKEAIMDDSESSSQSQSQPSNSSQANTPSQSQSHASTQNTPSVQAPPSSQETVQSKPSNKRYMFSDGYDMSSAPSACQNDLFSSNHAGGCIPLQDASGIYIGMELQFY